MLHRESHAASNPKPPLVQIALYAFPLGWLALFFVSLLKFNISYVSLSQTQLVGDVAQTWGLPFLTF